MEIFINSFENYNEVKKYLISGNDENKSEKPIDNKYMPKSVQNPCAVVLTCSDARILTEHIFDVGVGELFVIRTAGNIVGKFDLGSIEYGVKYLGAKLVIVLGHRDCGAVCATINNNGDGYIKKITDEISVAIKGYKDSDEAEEMNVRNSVNKIMQSDIISSMVENNEISVQGAIYDVHTGSVEFLNM